MEHIVDAVRRRTLEIRTVSYGRGTAIAMAAAVGVYEPRAIADAVLHEVVRCPLAACLAQTTQLSPIALRCRFHRSRPRQWADLDAIRRLVACRQLILASLRVGPEWSALRKKQRGLHPCAPLSSRARSRSGQLDSAQARR